MNGVAFFLVFALCCLIQGIFSFGGGMIIVPILSRFFSIKDFIIPVISLFNIFTNAYTYARCKKMNSSECINALNYKKIIFFGMIGNIIGSSLLITYLSDAQIKFILGTVILINVIFSNRLPFSPFGSKQFVAGFFSGLLGGSISLGNLGIVLVYGKNKQNELKSFIASFCLFQNVVTFFIYLLNKRYSLSIVCYSLFSMLICVIFQGLGMKLSERFSNDQFSFILKLFLSIIGMYLFVTSL